MRGLLLGGDGYVGRYLQRASSVIAESVSADLRPSTPDVVFCDVRRDIGEALVTQFEVDAVTARSDLVSFLTEMMQEGLVELLT